MLYTRSSDKVFTTFEKKESCIDVTLILKGTSLMKTFFSKTCKLLNTIQVFGKK